MLRCPKAQPNFHVKLEGLLAEQSPPHPTIEQQLPARGDVEGVAQSLLRHLSDPSHLCRPYAMSGDDLPTSMKVGHLAKKEWHMLLALHPYLSSGQGVKEGHYLVP